MADGGVGEVGRVRRGPDVGRRELALGSRFRLPVTHRYLSQRADGQVGRTPWLPGDPPTPLPGLPSSLWEDGPSPANPSLPHHLLLRQRSSDNLLTL